MWPAATNSYILCLVSLEIVLPLFWNQGLILDLSSSNNPPPSTPPTKLAKYSWKASPEVYFSTVLKLPFSLVNPK